MLLFTTQGEATTFPVILILTGSAIALLYPIAIANKTNSTCFTTAFIINPF
ncbi:hypothetical protein D3C75_1181400 [compost metagenome]